MNTNVKLRDNYPTTGKSKQVDFISKKCNKEKSKMINIGVALTIVILIARVSINFPSEDNMIYNLLAFIAGIAIGRYFDKWHKKILLLQ